jgi:hypothetical protein
MEARHRIDFFDTEIIVYAKDDTSFQVSINSTKTPLGLGNVLETYSSEQTAIQAAERFFQIYSVAKENGYYLQNDYFTKPDKEKIRVTLIINSDYSAEQLAAQFN